MSPRSAFLACAFAIGCGHPAPAAESPVVDVPPGAVVRWAGEGIESCASGARTFAPIAGSCWYPVDLLAGGKMEVSRRRGGAVERRTLRPLDYPYPIERVEIADDRKVHPSAQDLERIAAEQKRVSALWSLDTPRRFSLPLAAPLERLPAGGRFGARRIFNGEPRSPHSGTDFPVAEGTPVYAAAAGRVALAEDQFFAGRTVYLDHGDGLITMYFHLSEVFVPQGQDVEAHQRIGSVGATGRVSGPHLHFAARWRGARVDPAMLLGTSTPPAIE